MTLPNIKRVRARSGALYLYHRGTGARLPDRAEDHPEFLRAWAEQERLASSATPKPEAGHRRARHTLDCAVADFKASHAFRGLSRSYQPVIRRHVEAIAAAYGDAALADVARAHIEADLHRLSPAAARSRRKAWRQLCGWAYIEGRIADDPSEGARAPRLPRSDGHPPVTPAEVARVRAHWPIEHPRRLAFELAYWTAARISDLVTLSRGMVLPNGLLAYRKKKPGRMAYVPWRAPLPDFADPVTWHHLQAAIAAQAPALVFVLTRSGTPRSDKAAGQWLAETLDLAGVPGKSAHGLRKGRMIDIAERGGSASQLTAWSGHQTLTEAEDYIRQLDRMRVLLGTDASVEQTAKRAALRTEQQQNVGKFCQTGDPRLGK